MSVNISKCYASAIIILTLISSIILKNSYDYITGREDYSKIQGSNYGMIFKTMLDNKLHIKVNKL